MPTLKEKEEEVSAAGKSLRDKIWNVWRVACENDGGYTTMPAHLENEFRILLKLEGARHALENKPREEQYLNQVSVPNPGGRITQLVYNILTPAPIEV